MIPLIQANHLSKIYNSGTMVIALNDLDLAIQQGESIAIIGKSGSGKTTLLHAIGGIEQPTKGEVFFEGDSLYALTQSQRCRIRRKKIGFVFQFFNLIPELTIYENIVFPVFLDGKKPDQSYLKRILEILDIGDKLNNYPNQLSGGQQQRAAIARALINKPSLLCADEPTGNLDEASGKEVVNLFKICHSEFGQTILFVTHDQEIANQMDRKIVLKDGQIATDSGVDTSTPA